MTKTKMAVTLEPELVDRLDRCVVEARYANRSRLVEEAVMEKLERLDRSLLARECAKLDPIEEQAMAEEGIRADAAEWPEY
jgi:metal-responsive CopG/Arc/MetJ family transcriptional regulator